MTRHDKFVNTFLSGIAFFYIYLVKYYQQLAHMAKIINNKYMKGKTGNLILNRKVGESVQVDGPATFTVKEIKKGKVILLIDANDETEILRGSKETAEHKEDAKE